MKTEEENINNGHEECEYGEYGQEDSSESEGGEDEGVVGVENTQIDDQNHLFNPNHELELEVISDIKYRPFVTCFLEDLF